MNITSVKLRRLSLPLSDPYAVAYEHYETAENVLVRISAGGLNGWGCAAPDMHVTGETPEEVFRSGEMLLPGLLDKKDPFRRALIMKHLKRETPGLHSLHAAVDMALWDLVGKKAGLPVWKILGGYRERIRTSVTVGICGVEETLRLSRKWLDEGFSILKIKGGQDPELDVERIREVRRQLGPKITIRFDANQGYTAETAIRFAALIAELDVELFEQPTPMAKPDLLGRVTRKSDTPIMADESLLSLIDTFHLVKQGLVDLVNIKLMKAGGISEAIQMDAVARSAGVEVMVGCMDETALGIAAGLHFALSRKNIRYADLDGHLGLQGDPTAGVVILKKGFLYPSPEPGLGWDGELLSPV
jgi:L-Ala-D/L-Glu epimerase